MNTHLDSTLRTLDAAPAGLSVEERGRADALRDQIVTTPRPIPRPATRPSPRPLRRTARRLVLVPVAAVALGAVGAVVLPGLGGGDQVAYASWTAVPATVAEQDLEAVSVACEEQLRDFVDDDSSPVALDAGDATRALAERRGEYVAVLYRWEDPDTSISCLAHNRAGTDDVDDVRMSSGGSTGPALAAPARGLTQGAIAQFGTPVASITDGAVGSDVVGVTIHAGRQAVSATVRNGRYVAWWPGSALEDGPGGVPRVVLRYDLTLADGTRLVDVQPTTPS